MYEILKGMNPNIHTGNLYRIAYYFYNAIETSGLPPRYQGSQNPDAGLLDKSTGFARYQIGSTEPDQIKC
jgi:hypothetical protein